MPTIRASERRAHAEATLGEIESVSYRAPDAVIRNPSNQRRIDAALKDQIFDQTPYRIIGKCGDYRRIQTKAALQPAGDVVFPAPLPASAMPRGGDAPVTRIQTQHHLAERHEVPSAILSCVDLHACSTTAGSSFGARK